jgi:hypothetical protein
MNGVLPGAAGAIILKKIMDAVLPDDYKDYSMYAIGGAGLLAALMIKNPLIQAAGIGAATVSVANLGEDFVNGGDFKHGLGLYPPGQPSTFIAANYRPRYSPLNGPNPNGFPGQSDAGGVVRQ